MPKLVDLETEEEVNTAVDDHKRNQCVDVEHGRCQVRGVITCGDKRGDQLWKLA
jgi:hypothetical protein